MAITRAGSPVRGVVASVMLLAALGLTACMPGPSPIENFAGVPLVAAEPVPATDGDGEEGTAGGEGETEAEGEEGVAGEEEGTEVELVELEVVEDEPRAVYLDDGGRIAIVLWGSSGCPPIGTSMNVVEDAESGNTVRVEVAPIPEGTACTADLAPHTTVFWTPVYIATTQPLRILVGDEEIELPIK